MAKIGLNNFRYAVLLNPYTDGAPSYDGAKSPGKAISCSVDISNNSELLFADDVLAESDTSFQKGTVKMGIDEDDLQTMATLLGHKISESGEIIRNSNDAAPYVGLGRIVVKMVNGVYKYKVEFLYKVKFSEPSSENNTKEESLKFYTTELEGTVATLANGDWSVAKTFNLKSDAIAYLESLMAAPSDTVTLTYDANGGVGTIEPVSVAVNASVTLNDGSTLIAPESKEFSGWATTSTASVPDATSPYTVTENITLYAVWVNSQ